MSAITIETVHVKERPILCIRHIGPYQGIGLAFTALEDELAQLGIKAEAMLALYHDNPAVTPQASLRSDAAAQVCENHHIATQRLTADRIAAGRFARWIHKGPYSGLHTSWQAGYQAMHQLGLQSKGICYEEYLNDPCNTAPQDLMTAIYQQIE
nr:AraC family transcriptional regulator [Oxalobacteraceae bacterium]